jgi:hypothetical protein
MQATQASQGIDTPLYGTDFPLASHRRQHVRHDSTYSSVELLKHELGESDEDICYRLQTDFAVMDACGL